MADSVHSSTSAGAVDWSLELERHGRWLRAVLLARSREPAAVEELLQEVALTAVRESDSLRDAERTAPWLYRIAVRKALLLRRRLGRQRRLRESVAVRLDEATACGIDPHEPLAWLLADERKQLIREALDSLASKDAELLLLKYSENWTYREIAEHLGLTESAVDARLHRARQKLRRELTKRNIVEVTQ